MKKKSPNLISHLKTCDYESILHLKEGWRYLSRCEKYFVLESAFLLEQFSAFKNLLEKSKYDDDQFIFHCFSKKMEAESHKNPGYLLPEFMDLYESAFEEPLIRADILFYMGFIANQSCSFDVGYSYLKRSKNLFQENNLDAYVWRADVNMAISKLRGQSTTGIAAKNLVVLIQKNFSNLSLSEKRYMYKVLFHFLGFLGDYKNGEKSALNAIKDLDDSQIIYFDQAIRHLIYFRFKTQKTPLIESFLEKKDLSDFNLEMLELILSPLTGLESIETRVLNWKTTFNEIHLEYLIDILFEKLLRANLNIETLNLLEFVSSEVFTKQSQAPIFHLNFYRMKASGKYGKMDIWQKNVNSLQRSLPDIKTPFIENAKLGRVDGIACNLVINKKNYVISINQKVINLSKSKMVFDLILAIANIHKPIHYVDLFEQVYCREYRGESDKNKIESIVNRARKILGNHVIARSENRFFLESAKSQVIGESDRRQKRLDRIMEIFTQSEKPIPLALINQKINISRRTLLSDISLLKEREEIESVGEGRGTKYAMKMAKE